MKSHQYGSRLQWRLVPLQNQERLHETEVDSSISGPVTM